MPKLSIRTICLLVSGSVSLAGCGSANDTNASATGPNTPASRDAGDVIRDGGPKFTLADGPDVCFRAVAKQLGPDTKVAELTSFFSIGKEIDPSNSASAGEMTLCTAQYQNPQDPRKLLEVSMDAKSGAFAAPRPVEITVMGGDAAKFNLEDHLIPLSQVNPAGLKVVMAQLNGSMDQIYSKHAWSGVRLMSPGAFDPKHALRIDIEGRLATNDIKEGGYAAISTDGKTIIRNFLKP